MSTLLNPLFWLAVALTLFLLSALIEIWNMRESLKRAWFKFKQGRADAGDELDEEMHKPVPTFVVNAMFICYYALIATAVTLFVKYLL